MIFVISIIVIALLGLAIVGPNELERLTVTKPAEENTAKEFSGGSAYAEVLYQVSLGPRNPGSIGHSNLQDHIQLRLTEYGFAVEAQTFLHRLPNGSSLALQNIVAKSGNESNGILLIGAHYDTRPISENDKDPEKKALPILGANDGASGVAVLLELARVYSEVDLPIGLWLLFFDAEDIGGVYGPYSLGSSVFADSLPADMLPSIKGVIVVDMVGDSDLQLFYDRNSLNSVSRELTEKIWAIGDDLGHSNIFKPEVKYTIYDDHIPFLQLGLPSTLIIDFDYEFWHTQQDTADRVTPASLQVVGQVLVKSIEAISYS
ncbi:MAG: M28 family peptidase [Nitrososphaerales archaeon]